MAITTLTASQILLLLLLLPINGWSECANNEKWRMHQRFSSIRISSAVTFLLSDDGAMKLEEAAQQMDGILTDGLLNRLMDVGLAK